MEGFVDNPFFAARISNNQAHDFGVLAEILLRHLQRLLFPSPSLRRCLPFSSQSLKASRLICFSLLLVQ